jgi:hypothetical protein
MKNEAGFAGHLLSTPPREGAIPVFLSGTHEVLCWMEGNSYREIRPADHPPTPPVMVNEAEYVRRMNILHHEMADKTITYSKCYFIGGEDGLIKIGHSIDPTGRLRDIQACSPVELSILATRQGGEMRERAYHWQFSNFRRRGEWFERAPAILAEIERLSQ